MSDLDRDLAEVIRGLDDPDNWKVQRDFIRTHHAEIARDREDAARWRALKWAEAPMVTVTGSQLARGIRPGDFAVPWDWPITSKTRVRLIIIDAAMKDSQP